MLKIKTLFFFYCEQTVGREQKMVPIICDCSFRLSDLSVCLSLREKDNINVKYCVGGLCSALPAVLYASPHLCLDKVVASPKKMASNILFEAEVRRYTEPHLHSSLAFRHRWASEHRKDIRTAMMWPTTPKEYRSLFLVRTIIYLICTCLDKIHILLLK